mmetsp:Transcript_13230/g.30273  ORF Transcript_13230/g.30273 Transcript_13230/m.30273 type:complete len:84 (+) Transcript_13230:1614-1865(+)
MRRHGPHHVAQKYTSTGPSCASISADHVGSSTWVTTDPDALEEAAASTLVGGELLKPEKDCEVLLILLIMTDDDDEQPEKEPG